MNARDILPKDWQRFDDNVVAFTFHQSAYSQHHFPGFKAVSAAKSFVRQRTMFEEPVFDAWIDNRYSGFWMVEVPDQACGIAADGNDATAVGKNGPDKQARPRIPRKFQHIR